MNKYIKKILFLSTFFVSIFFFAPKDTYAYNYVRCSVFTDSWQLLQQGEDDACSALNVPRQNQILDVVYEFKNRRLVQGANYNVNFSWWYIGSSSWQIRHTEMNIGGNVVTNSGVSTFFTSDEQYSQTMFLFNLRTQGEFTSPATSDTLIVDIGTYYSSNSIVVGYNQDLSFVQTSGGNSGTSSSDVADRINDNNNRNTDRIIDSQNQINESINDMNDNIMSDDTTDAEDSAEDFFNDFTVNNHGLASIITAPLRLLNSLSSSTCSALVIPLPFVQQNVTLPCMSSIYNTYFHDFLVIYQLITTGLISYWVVIKIYGHVKGMQNPTDDRIEVFDL